MKVADFGKNCDCRIAVAEQHFSKSCGIAIAELLPSSCGIALADSKKSCVCPPLPISSAFSSSIRSQQIYYCRSALRQEYQAGSSKKSRCNATGHHSISSAYHCSVGDGDLDLFAGSRSKTFTTNSGSQSRP